MFGKHFQLNEQTLSIVEQIGRHMPGGFFIYQANQPKELIYVNRAVLDIFGCNNLQEFKELTGYTFKGMLHPDDYASVSRSIDEQIQNTEDNFDYVEYRIIRKDGSIRWVDDYGHYTETEAYGGIYYVFISDITQKRKEMESDLAIRNAVIEALSESYHAVWLISDVEKGNFFIIPCKSGKQYCLYIASYEQFGKIAIFLCKRALYPYNCCTRRPRALTKRIGNGKHCQSSYRETTMECQLLADDAGWKQEIFQNRIR